jgi:flavin-binding protein dodecin
VPELTPAGPNEGNAVSDPTYSVTEIVGTSGESIEQAVRSGLDRAGRTLRNLDWFEVEQIRGAITDGKVSAFQVTMKLGFRIEGP